MALYPHRVKEQVWVVTAKTSEHGLHLDRSVLLIKHSLTPGKPLAKIVELGPSDTLKVVLTTQEGKTAKRPNQAFLLLRDEASNLDISYPLSVKESGKAKIDLVRRYHIKRILC